MAWRNRTLVVYVRAVYGHWRGFTLGLLPFLVPLLLSYVKVNGERRTVPWWAWLAAFAGGLVLAQFKAWKDMRSERDRARSDLDDLKTRVSGRSLEISGLTLGIVPEVNGLQLGLVFHNFGREVVRYRVDDFSLAIADKPATSNVNLSEADIAPGGTDTFRLPMVDDLPDSEGELWGLVEFEVVYGHPDLPPARRMHQKLNLIFTGTPIDTVTSSPAERSDEVLREKGRGQ